MVTVEKKKEDLRQAIEARHAEVWGYELNVEVYRKILRKTAQEPRFEHFLQDVQQRLEAELLERSKAEIVLACLEELLAEIE